MAKLTQARLEEILNYDPKTGKLYRAATGLLAGGRNVKGYFTVNVDGERFYSHRLVWFYVYGQWPAQIDHINGDKADNRICNLREATGTQNLANTKRPINNKSGYKGVCWCPKRRMWRAYATKQKRQHHLGYFNNPKTAHAAYIAAAIELHGEFARFK